VLYLAEVIQKKGGLMGGSKAELKLLACQRTEQNWTAVSGEEVIPADEASRYSPGTLLLVDLTNSKQVQRIQEAGRPLVSILQNFSRLQEKFKTQEEEIEQWKQSLTYQSQELNRREMEMEARREQLEQLESDFEQLEQQRQQFEQIRSEVEGQKEEFDRQKQEMEGAWDHLRGEMNRLEERKAEMGSGAVLDEEQAQRISQLLQKVEASVVSVDTLQEQSNYAHEVVEQQQQQLQHHWSQLEQYRSQVGTAQAELDQTAQNLQQEWQAWRESSESLTNARAELKVQQSALQMKQESVQALNLQLQHHEDIHQQLYRMTEGLEGVDVGQPADVSALEAMALDTLQTLVGDLEQEFNKSSQFVMGQEEELDSKQKEIDDLQAKMATVNDFDRMSLESELADEQDAYQFLNETLVGQRRSLREKQSLLRQHQSVLARRQGKADPHATEGALNLGPVFAQIDSFRQQRTEELQQVETQLEQIRCSIEQTQSMVNQQTQEIDRRRQELEQKDQDLQAQKLSLRETHGKVALYEEMLQPFQDRLTDLKGRTEFIAASLSQFSASGSEQREALAQVQEAFASLSQTPQLVA
jgi:chromosome segregation ATPase